MGTQNFGPRLGGNATSLNIAAAAVVKATGGQLWTVNNSVLGTSVGSVHDCATTGAATAANLVASIPEAIGTYTYNMPFFVGMVVVPGTAQVLAVAYS